MSLYLVHSFLYFIIPIAVVVLGLNCCFIYGGEYIIINKCDVIIMSSVYLYNPYREGNLNLLDKLSFDKWQLQELKMLS